MFAVGKVDIFSSCCFWACSIELLLNDHIQAVIETSMLLLAAVWLCKSTRATIKKLHFKMTFMILWKRMDEKLVINGKNNHTQQLKNEWKRKNGEETNHKKTAISVV